MKLIYKGRGEGKTTELIKLSAETNTYILVKDRNRQREVADLAQALGYDSMLFPVTLFEHFEAGRSKGMINRRFLIDDADDILQYLIGVDIPILACSWTKNDEESSMKFADQIVKEMDERGAPIVPDCCVTGEEFEKWLRREAFIWKRTNDK